MDKSTNMNMRLACMEVLEEQKEIENEEETKEKDDNYKSMDKEEKKL